MILIDFARYYVIAKNQGNHEAARMIRSILMWYLDAAEAEVE